VSSHRTRLVNVGAALVVAGAVVGFAVGTRPLPETPGPPPPPPTGDVAAAVQAGRPYAALRTTRYDEPRRVTGRLARLRAGFPAVGETVVRRASTRSATLALRAERRAFEGAPPVVPHAIDQQHAAACLACHRDGLLVEGHPGACRALDDRLLAPRIPHEAYASCTQCHVSAAPPFGGEPPRVATGFSPLPAGAGGPRAGPVSPPRVPHGTLLREDCASCHGVTGWPGLRTTHPERQQCLQCHVEAAGSLPWVHP